MLEQDSTGAVIYSRVGDSWTHAILIAASSLALPAVGIEFPLAELYEGLDFEAPDEGKTADV